VETREDIRSLIGEVVMTPGEKRGESHAVLRGELMAILDLAAGRRRTPRQEVITKELAGPRFEPTSRRLDGAWYSHCASNLLTYLAAESAVSSENPLYLLRIRVDFDSTIRRFESSRPSQPAGLESIPGTGHMDYDLYQRHG
jgi:hypothetical protein